jgi:hypothetical protein
MNFRKTIVTAVVGAGIVLAFSVVSASADIVCNDMGVCWHTHNPYDYPAEAHVKQFTRTNGAGVQMNTTYFVSMLVGATGAAITGSTGKPSE